MIDYRFKHYCKQNVNIHTQWLRNFHRVDISCFLLIKRIYDRNVYFLRHCDDV